MQCTRFLFAAKSEYETRCRRIQLYRSQDIYVRHRPYILPILLHEENFPRLPLTQVLINIPHIFRCNYTAVIHRVSHFLRSGF